MSSQSLTLSDKYIAGFTDADGSISLQLRRLDRSPNARPCLVMVWSQRSDSDRVLYGIQASLGGTLSTKKVNGASYSSLVLCGSKARYHLERILPYLVIKKDFARFCLERTKLPVHELHRHEYLAARQRVSQGPNFPSRKWLAGYFDGDGCISCSRLNRNGSANLVACISCSIYDRVGIDVIQKNFGGHIYPLSSSRASLLQWRLALPPSKAIQFFEYFVSHSIVKRSQIDFILSHARVGHFANGEYIRQELKRLKNPSASTD